VIPELESRNVKSINNISEGNREVKSDEPEIGMTFSSVDEVYEFYRRYASKMGFNVRKGKGRELENKIVKSKTYLCSREGHRAKKQCTKKTKFRRKETRTGCKAQLQIKFQKEKYEIVKFEAVHNHELQESTQRDCKDLHSEILEAETLNQPTHENEAAKTVEAGAHASPCDMNYCKDLGDKKMNNLQSEDAQELINYLTQLQVEDPSLFHIIQVDDESHVTNFFWWDDRSMIDYNYFGDVLILDTTFRMERYNKICAQFLGVNHHQQPVLFGCSFLDETKESFTWLLQNFLEQMGRRQPKTIFTSECQAIMKAVGEILPETQHRLCKQFVCQNVKQHLSMYYGQPEFKSLFSRCLFDCQSEGDFELMWKSFLEKYNLHENPWLQNMYTLRTKSSDLFNKRTFCADLYSIHGSEKFSNANFFQNSKTKPMTLPEYVQIYKEAVEQHRKKEQDEDISCDAGGPELIPDSPMLKQASDKYTPTMFKIFQKNLLGIISVPSEEITSNDEIVKFKVTEGENTENIVEFKISDHTTTCSCKLFESVGILCVHALKVLNAKNIFQIPQQHILKRWTKSARDGVEEVDNGKEIADESYKRLRKRKLRNKILHLINSMDVEYSRIWEIADYYMAKLEKECEEKKAKNI
jgi:hypothetical protein